MKCDKKARASRAEGRKRTMSDRKKRLTRYLLIHFAVLLYGIFILLWSWSSRRLGVSYFCLSHDLLGIYCPFCGGTRALKALLLLDLPAAFGYNAAFVLTLPLLLFFDIRALVCILQNRLDKRLFPHWALITVVAVFTVFFLLRNLLAFAFGIDFAGDFR